MLDQARLWKVGFGTLVLAFCVVNTFTRKPGVAPHPAEVQEEAPARIEITVEDPPAPLPAPAPAPAAAEMTKVEPPVRVARRTPAPLRAAPVVHMARVMPAPRLHAVVARRVVAKRRNHGPQYPFLPGERWASREMP